MNRNECIKIACKIKETGKYEGDISALLYSCVGMIKLSPDAGTAFASNVLKEAIEEAKIPLSPFCQRKIEIIKDNWLKGYARVLGKMIDMENETMLKDDLQ